MEGPTPVSALIHAATMVAAGVFLVARFYPVFQASEYALTVVALVGAFTALMAATMALVMNDIKRVMAYSTISQLGYMMAALGVGAYRRRRVPSIDPCLFQSTSGSWAPGSVNHATGTFDMRYMGGLWRRMPLTYRADPRRRSESGGDHSPRRVSGVKTRFWSAPGTAVVWWRVGVSRLTFAMLVAGVLLTAFFYTFRMLIMTFHGEFRGGVDRELEHQGQAGPDQVQAAPGPSSSHTRPSRATCRCFTWPSPH